MKVGLIAGNGTFPLEVAESISQKNKEVFREKLSLPKKVFH